MQARPAILSRSSCEYDNLAHLIYEASRRAPLSGSFAPVTIGFIPPGIQETLAAYALLNSQGPMAIKGAKAGLAFTVVRLDPSAPLRTQPVVG